MLAIDAIHQLKDGRYDASLETLAKMDAIGLFYANQKTLFEMDRIIENMFILETKFSDTQKNFLKKIAERNDASLAADPGRLYYYLTASRIRFIAGRFDPGQYEKSQALLQKMIDSGTKRMEVYMDMAENYQALGQNDKAIEFGEKAVAIDPTYGFADYNFARLYRLMGNNDQAIRYIDKALANGYDGPALFYLYADTANAIPDYDRSIIAFSRIVKIAPNDPQNYANLAMAYFNKKDYAKAREVSIQIQAKFPKLRAQMQTFIDKLPN
jgi:tetratricopeptide (TPR) repeat protein